MAALTQDLTDTLTLSDIASSVNTTPGGRLIPSLTEQLARIAANLPVTNVTILPDVYQGRLS